jgi:hypothetical protein
MRQLGHDLPPVLRRPAAVLAAGLASVALGGCFGGGDATLNFKAACSPGQSLREARSHWYGDHDLVDLDMVCEDASGHTATPLYIQEKVVTDVKPIKPNFDMSIKVNGKGHWYSMINGHVTANYRAVPYGRSSEPTVVTLNGIDRIESVKITEVKP